MTEKRFELAYETNDQNCIWWAVRDGDVTLWKEEVVELLNELHEENKKLKQVNEMLQMDFVMTERNLIEENEQLRNRLKDWHQRTFKAHEYFNILEKIIDEVCDDDINNQVWEEYEKREKLVE